MRNYPARTLLGVSLSASNTDNAIQTMRELSGLADVIELRLDLIPDFDLPRLLASRTTPVVVTYRPTREGGRFSGDEQARLETLRLAAKLGAEVIDIEWDSFSALGNVAPAERMISRHFFEHMPPNFSQIHQELAASGAEIIKLVGMARRLADVIPVFETLETAQVRTVAIAMGEFGALTRILAPRFYPAAWLTYASAGNAQAVAPGQITIQELRERYRAHEITRETPIHGVFPQSDATISSRADCINVPCVLAADENHASVQAHLARWIRFDD